MFAFPTKKCPRCETTVYANDAQVQVTSGAPWHKSCFRCEDCNCQLTLTNFTVSGNSILCKTHYFSRFHKSNKYDGDEKFIRQRDCGKIDINSKIKDISYIEEPVNAKISNISLGGNDKTICKEIKSIDIEKNSMKEANEKMLSEEKASSHRLACTTTENDDQTNFYEKKNEVPSEIANEEIELSSNKQADKSGNEEKSSHVMIHPLDSVTASSDNIIKKLNITNPYTSEKVLSKQQDCNISPCQKKKFIFGGSPKCYSCNSSVYQNDDKVKLDSKIWHKSCFKCSHCLCQLTLTNFTHGGDKLLCKTHYFEMFHKKNEYAGGENFKRKTRQIGNVAS